MVQRSVNGSVEWLDIPQSFYDTGLATVAWNENLYVDPWRITDIPTRSTSSPDNPFNLRNVARRVHDDILCANHLERFQNLLRETLPRFLLDNRDEVLSDDDWLEGDWDLAD